MVHPSTAQVVLQSLKNIRSLPHVTYRQRSRAEEAADVVRGRLKAIHEDWRADLIINGEDKYTWFKLKKDYPEAVESIMSAAEGVDRAFGLYLEGEEGWERVEVALRVYAAVWEVVDGFVFG